MEAETGVIQMQDKGPQGFSGATRNWEEERKVSTKNHRERGPAANLTWDLWPLEPGGNKSLLFKSPSLCYFVSAASLWKPIHNSVLKMGEQTCLNLHSLSLQSEPLPLLLSVEACYPLPPST